jgi:hypothetical protein
LRIAGVAAFDPAFILDFFAIRFCAIILLFWCECYI